MDDFSYKFFIRDFIFIIYLNKLLDICSLLYITFFFYYNTYIYLTIKYAIVNIGSSFSIFSKSFHIHLLILNFNQNVFSYSFFLFCFYCCFIFNFKVIMSDFICQQSFRNILNRFYFFDFLSFLILHLFKKHKKTWFMLLTKYQFRIYVFN